VYLTKDEQVVVVHDRNLLRVTGVDKLVTALNFSELPNVRNVPSDGREQGMNNEAIPPEGCPIPLLSQVLKLLRDNREKSVLIELKQASALLVQKVTQLLKMYGLIKNEQVVWFSLDKHINDILVLVNPDIPRVASVLENISSTILYWLGLLPIVPISFQVFGTSSGNIQEFVHDLPVIKHWPTPVIVALCRCFKVLLAPKRVFQVMKSRGIPCYVLGVNQDSEFEFACDIQADSILSDNPKWLDQKYIPNQK